MQKSIYKIKNLQKLKNQLLQLADQNLYSVYLDSNEYAADSNTQWECLVGLDAAMVQELNAGNDALALLDDWQISEKPWLFGFFGYDLKNEVEKLSSNNIDGIGFSDLCFFQPRIVCGIKANKLHIYSQEMPPKEVLKLINSCFDYAHLPPLLQSIHLKARLSKEKYLETVEKIKTDIAKGDYYELNLCQEFYAENVEISPMDLFSHLNSLGKSPFSSFVKISNRYLCCASPERFMQKKGSTLLSQPIKGTRKRGKTTEEDQQIAHELSNAPKDRAENVMIVDLVRNDLARSSEAGSVKVTDLFGIYPFQSVFQMISTVHSTKRADVSNVTAIRNAFPPGSMTGAPKAMAMERIEGYEQTKRGLFSGSVGYFSPDGDFDFNVVIRSILYNAETKYLSFQVGGAIVYDSVPEQEYEECLVKAENMMRVLGSL
jgi:para-aminobenzoate synthetase component I